MKTNRLNGVTPRSQSSQLNLIASFRLILSDGGKNESTDRSYVLVPCTKCRGSWAKATHPCFASSHTERVGRGKLLSWKAPTATPIFSGLKSASQNTVVPHVGQKCIRSFRPSYPSRT